ncbi:hypothetical protein [Virgibacillus halodenitrificans]|uniref:hypothetical protein n=1 Tax=Virgibacillus halodenitrificans TaxID=1482 RepID=UPI00045D516E|nr:hypothetical protein [Virgibacillus halodenitrificans]MCG1029430.1 hypothetical protein [Virgibacillus halodenitrificans]CDQ36033.1 hypothetical protein BN993_05524 [Virgibacillus halodenitrificans]
MKKVKLLTIVLLTITLFACNSNNALEPTNKNNHVELTKISTNQAIDQHASNEAKELLSKYKEIIKVNAVNTEKELIATVEVRHQARLQLSEIRKKLKNKLVKNFPDYKIELSTDKKLVLEVEKAEKQIEENSYTSKELKKKVKELIELSREQT